MLTADWVRLSWLAARVKERLSATATKAFNSSGSRRGTLITKRYFLYYQNSIP
jgi:hypothetical protein